MSSQKRFIVYLVTNTVNGRRYIGITRQLLRKRWGVHCAPKNDTVLGYAIQKYGKEAFTIEELYVAATEEEMMAKESELIVSMNTLLPDGYNMKVENSYNKSGKYTPELLQKISTRNKAWWDSAEEGSKQRALAPIKEYVDNKRRPVVRVCMSTGAIFKEASCNLCGFSAGSVHRAATQGEYYKNFLWFFDLGQDDSYFSDLAIKKLGRLQPENLFPVVATEITTEKEQTFSNIKDLCKSLNLNISAVRKCLKGVNSHTKGYRISLASQAY